MKECNFFVYNIDHFPRLPPLNMSWTMGWQMGKVWFLPFQVNLHPFLESETTPTFLSAKLSTVSYPQWEQSKFLLVVKKKKAKQFLGLFSVGKWMWCWLRKAALSVQSLLHTWGEWRPCEMQRKIQPKWCFPWSPLQRLSLQIQSHSEVLGVGSSMNLWGQSSARKTVFACSLSQHDLILMA